MDIRTHVLQLAAHKKEIKSADIAKRFDVSRQFASRIIGEFVAAGKLVRVGSTRSAFYVAPDRARSLRTVVQKRFANNNLKEHEMLEALEDRTPLIRSLPENVHSIFTYAFSEMLNNAIDHSQSPFVQIAVERDKNFIFRVEDTGIGVFRNIRQRRKLTSDLEALQDLLKGKTTTAPEAHSGEGIFFTSKIADRFVLESFGLRLTIDNVINDVFVEEVKPVKKGTKVFFQIATGSKKHLMDVFKKFQSDPEERAFDKTEVQIKLYTMGTIHVSRSQARRVLAGLEKFKLIVLDFERVPTVGQAFADEIFRVFQRKHPHIEIRAEHMNDAVRFMVERTEK